ncbi:conserved Plasmodium protein, unknown function [Plasmodium berghei]|uniref:Uncharacterized protein n=2 Tax=Plasmodium berghei TaxID=5821 RepID=A0A509AJA3_PLABA|nr:conserved Plasmodium protein, unknown function [Plasmodium berghei ANKA]SCM19878.1 conserved Plasmodium protein, unknown function [Plasmodium berghei]SCN23607.1 conserved Plasmodium protein, unknown function [Plasmodium berghei]SCO59172.1 conserved Plasmodium protein, unknown function [Plasmodium berghei]SCO59972.1 conserved Plasmodium protein, unknown function [Plasmodium berghei]VUC54860.1 conserved Plasmodium protein, unknown function [Plasmodium berghei ANKA]|eukprot:XP_034420685.1 conserved Plasmodium protein, unknown function [Plasmodium berghei ANKA]
MKLENESPTDKQIYNNNLMDHSYDSMTMNSKDMNSNNNSDISNNGIFVNHKIFFFENSKDDLHKIEKEEIQNESDLDNVKNNEFPNLISEEKKKLFYKKVDEILNMNNSNDDEWIKSENEKSSLNSIIIEKHEYAKKIKPKNVEPCYVKMKNKKKKYIDKNMFNESFWDIQDNELHKILKKNKYEYTKMNFTMDNAFYKYLYMCKKKQQKKIIANRNKISKINEVCQSNKINDSNLISPLGSNKYQTEFSNHVILVDAENVEKNNSWVNDSNESNIFSEELIPETEQPENNELELSKDINFLYIEYFIRSKKIINLRNIYKYIYNKRNRFYLKALVYKNVYILNCNKEVNKTYNNFASKNQTISKYCINNNFLCIAMNSNEIIVFSLKGLELNSRIFCKGNHQDDVKIKEFLSTLVPNEYEQNCMKINFNYYESSYCIIKNDMIKDIRNIDINNLNKLCICTDDSLHIYEIVTLENYVIKYKYIHSYNEKPNSLLTNNKIWLAYLINDKKFIYFTYFNIIYMNKNSKMFNNNIYTISKDIKFKYRLLNVQIHKQFLFSSYNNKVTVLKDEKLFFVIKFDETGEIIQTKNDKSENFEKKIGDNVNYKKVAHTSTNPFKDKDVINLENDENIKNVSDNNIDKKKKEACFESEKKKIKFIPFLSILEWENYFCAGYVNKLIIFEYSSSKVQIKKKIILKHNIYYLNHSVNNILIIYDKTYIYIYQIFSIDMEISLFQIFCKTYAKIQSYTILEEDNIYESFSSSIKCSIKNIKINRTDKIARFVFPLFNGPNNNGENNYDEKKKIDEYVHCSKLGSNANNFYVNLIYLYILNNNKVDIIVLNSLIYLIYLFFYHKKYDSLLILILYIYNGNIPALVDLPLREEERKNKIKKLLFLFFEMNMKSIIEGSYGSSITSNICKDKLIQNSEDSYESNSIFERHKKDGFSSDSLTYEFGYDSKYTSNEYPDKEYNYEKIREVESEYSEYIPDEKIYIKNEVVNKLYIEELLKLCRLAIELSIKFNINLYEYIFNLFKMYNIENIYFYLCECYIINKQICFTHHNLIQNFIEHFRKFYKICLFYNDICYDLFLFFCNYVSGKWIENNNNNRDDNKFTKWKYINKYIYFFKLKKTNYKHMIKQNGDKPSEEKNITLYADFEKYFCYKYLNIWKGLRHIKKIYSFICLTNKFCKIFENINLENVIESIISLLPVHISSFLYSRHNDDKITNCEFFLSYIIRKKNNFFYKFCNNNNINNVDFPIYIPSYIYINFYQTYFLFDYVYSVIFKIPFSLSINRYEIKNHEINFWIFLKLEEDRNIYNNFDINNLQNYFSVFFIYSKFFLSYKNSYFHSSINQNIILFINHLCRRCSDFREAMSYSQIHIKENKFMDVFLWKSDYLLVNKSMNSHRTEKLLNNKNLINNEYQENEIYKTNCNVNLNYFFNLDKNGIFLLFQLSLPDCFYIINNMFYYYNMSNEENLINNFVHNICDFYIHLISTLIYYTNNLKAILKNSFGSEICDDFVKNIFYGIKQSKGGFFKIKLFILKFFHYISSEKNYIISLNIQNIVTWIILQIYFIKREIYKIANCLTYMLILFFIFAKDEIFFEYKLNIYFINFLFQYYSFLNDVKNQNKLRTHIRMYRKRCDQQFFYYNAQNCKDEKKTSFMSYVSLFFVKNKNMFIKKNQIIKDNDLGFEKNTYTCDLVQYVIFRIYNIDLFNIFGDITLELNRCKKESNTHIASCYCEDDENKSKTTTKHLTKDDNNFYFKDRKETIFKNRGCDFNNFFRTNNKNKKIRKKKNNNGGNIFNMNNYKKNLKYILLLYVKKLIFIRDEENRKTNKSSSKDCQKKNKKRDINNLLKYIAFFSYIKKKKYKNIYLVILDYFCYYNPILEYYKNQNDLTKLYEYAYYKIYYFYNEKCVKKKLYGYIFYRDLFKHIHIFKDNFCYYILNSYFYFNKKTIFLLEKKMKKKYREIEIVKQSNIIANNTKSDIINRVDESELLKTYEHNNEAEEKQTKLEKETYKYYELNDKRSDNSDDFIGKHIIKLWKTFVKKLIYCNNFSDQLKQRAYFLLIYKCNMPYAIKKYVYKKIFSKYLNLLCMYNKEKVYKFVKYIRAELYQSIYIKYKIINVILYIYENSGDFIKITDLCLKEIKHKILSIFSVFNIKNEYEFSKNINYDDIYAINFSKKIDIYNFYSMPFKKNVLKKLGLKKKENTHTQLGEKDIFMNNLFKEINYEHGQNFYYYYFVGKKQAHKVQKLHDENPQKNDIANVDRDNSKYFENIPGNIKQKPQKKSMNSGNNKLSNNSDNNDGVEIKRKDDSEKIYMKYLIKSQKNKNIVDLMKCYWIYNTEEYNLIFLYIYMLTFILKRNKHKNNKLNEYIIFHIINECLKNIIEISEQVIKKEQNQNKMDFFSYLFEQILLFVININSHVHTQKICKKLLYKYKNHQIKLIKLPLIAILKKMIDEHTFFNDNCQIAENKIKEQIKTYTNGKKKGLIINFKPEHIHKFNTDLYYISSATGKHKNSDYENSQNTYFSTNGIVYINKCEHGYHFSCSQKCYLCDDFKK